VRVALICDWYSPRRGGIEAHLSELGSRLVAAGHSVHIITSTPGPGGRSDTGVDVHRLFAPRLPFVGVVFQPSAIREIGEVLERERIELVHTHVSIVAPVGIGATAEAQRRRVATVVTFHSFVPATPLWASIVGRLVGASEWKAVLTAVSSSVAAEVRNIAPANPIQVLPNAIDPDYWTPGQHTEHGGVNLVAVMRLRSKKRPMLLLDAAKEIKRSLPGKQFTLRIAGTGPLERSLKRAVERNQLGDCIDFVGWRDADGLRALLRDSDAFLSPTIRESFGLAALEARAVGVPVVAMRHSAVADFIANEESGLLASSDREFLDASVRIVNDDSLRNQIAQRNRAVRPDLTWDKSLRAHEAVYAQALKLSVRRQDR
jgi:glycosyltransferase involved in cell wall biosynthesis